MSEMVRKLLVVRMIHSASETALPVVGTREERRVWKQVWQNREAQEGRGIYEQFWESVWRSLEKRLRGEDFGKIRVYPEGNTMSGPEAVKRCEELAKEKGWLDARVVLKLVRKGATLMKAEDDEIYDIVAVDLALYEKDLLDKKIVPKKGREDELDKFMTDEINKERDECMAKNISYSLKKGETGVLFIGRAHHVEEWLPEDIEIEYLAEGALRRMEKSLAKAQGGEQGGRQKEGERRGGVSQI